MDNHVFAGTREEWMRRVLPSQSTDEECVVYWIHDNTCVRSITDGYVGVTTVKRYRARKLEHFRSGRFPKDAVMDVIHEGNIEGCYLYEAVLRPYPNMGWNKAAGGARGHKIGYPRSEETKRKIGAANVGAIRSDLSLRNKQSSRKCSCIVCRTVSSAGYLYRDHRDCLAFAGILKPKKTK